ncbi:hypothetical protein VTK73DRAFT_10295 [Phialemonium thermophilum]|uniref:Major facilitator superfamily (MFS) profile domain-containing protein n=1 Tax=Phialemonium thermophilum TaxID=223376 RepID=A0ABR3VXL2_9PEZI
MPAMDAEKKESENANAAESLESRDVGPDSEMSGQDAAGDEIGSDGAAADTRPNAGADSPKEEGDEREREREPQQQNRQDGQPQQEQPPLYSVFSNRVKVFVILMTVFSTIFSPFSSFIYLPAITPIAASYHRPISDLNLTVTVYQIMQALAPLFFGDLSDKIGRRPVYALTFAIYLGANVGLALQDSFAALMVLRALQSTGSSATVAIGSAVVADLTTSAERGGYITAVQASIQFAPALAPVLGGILTQYLGWRSVFWFLVITAGVFVLIYLPFVPEVSICRVYDIAPATSFLLVYRSYLVLVHH